MTMLVLGLLLFLGIHSVRIMAGDWRQAQIARLGEGPWKGLYSLASLAGFVLLVWGYGMARQQPMVLWTPPRAMNHVAALLMLLSFVLLAAAYVPRNIFKARLGHPMVLGVKTWALAHLLANGNLADLLLFGAFLIWAVACFGAARRRDRAAGTVYPPASGAGTAAAVAAGVVAWGLFAFWLHAPLIGVAPLG
jgi:uncharacterized membrane protein